MENLVLIVAIVLIIGIAVFYVYKSKKSGAKCIGCPDGCSCGNSEHNCNCEDKGRQ